MKKLKTNELGRVSPEAFAEQPKHNIVLVLDNVRSMHNVGSAFRTGDAFAIEKIYLCGVTGTPPHRDINKTAIGAQDTVAWEYAKESNTCVSKLKAEGYKICVIEQTDQSRLLQEMNFRSDEKIAFVFGNEVFGVSDDVLHLADRAIEIPQFGTKHSLNVSVSIGVVCWDYISKVI